MSYFNEVAEYQSYSHGEADFHFIYNSNSGGGQSFLGGQFINESGKLSSPTILDGRIGVFYIATGEVNNQKRRILLNDAKGRYEIKPRGEGSTSMKLGVGTTMVSPNKLISAFFMLPPTCTIKTPKNLDVSILTSNNYWLQSMWLECGKRSEISNEVYLMPIDFIYCGGSSKEGSGIGRYFKLDAERRIADIISLCENTSRIPESIRQYVKLFAEIYTENALFEYDRCSEAISRIMVTLSKDYPDKYTGIEDPLPFLMRIAFPNAPKHIHKSASNNESSLQKIFYGAPGTGKSHEVKRKTGEWLNEDEDQDLPNVFRTTFHPDTDYASFVGCYKPTMRKTGKKHQVDGKDVDDEEIIYEYVPQVFADAYVYAYNNPGTPTYLVIEEINRGNCAQIFGDLFQLLDRKDGKSEYKIKADKDLAKYLCAAKDKDGQDVLMDKDGIKDGKLCLPANLHILATMNTSDQSLFPMDSAFKRRWDWEYIPIKYSNSNWRIDIAGYKYSWIDFQTEINKRIFGATESEDKQLGDFFVKADDNNIISSKLLLNKVIFYLWNDVCKDGDGDIFKVNTDLDYSKELDPAKNEDITFSKFFKETDLKLKQWMRYLNIKPLESQDDDDEEKEDEAHQQEDGVKPNEAKPDTYSKPEYKSIIENMLPQLSNEDISIFRNGFDWSFSDMPGSYARMSLALDAPAKNKKATVKLYIPAPTGYSKSAECFAYLKDHRGEDIIRTTASKYDYEYEELGIHSKNPNPVVGWKITIPMTFAPENSQAESQKLLDILSEVRTAFDPIISDFLKK